ncbi:MAG: hypothetical protein WC666_04855, partial [Candidatus Paceibacterota bacterium]
MSSIEFASANLKAGQLNALVKNIMKQTGVTDPVEAVRLFNAGEWVISKKTCTWYEKNGVIYLSVTSDGTTGSQWIERLEDKNFHLRDYTKSVLCSLDFKPTSGVTTKIAVL